METPQSKGRQFEKDLAEEFGIKQVPGSGSVWHSKLDLYGSEARWSLKFSEKKQFPISYNDIEEALQACFGLGGDGATPIWAARIDLGDFVIMRKEDWVDMQSENFTSLINKGNPKAEARKAQARLPELLRDDGDQ